MRIYGASPLYNYVELVFRCRRLFIVAVILGTVITSYVASTRKTLFTAEMVISLAGDLSARKSLDPNKKEDRSVQRKAARLVGFFLPEDRSFLNQVIENANLDKAYPDKSRDELVKELREAISSDDTIIEGQYLKLTMKWPNPAEAEKVLNEVFYVYSARIVNEETALQTSRLQMLQRQFDKYDKQANEQGQRKMRWLQEHWWMQPSMMGSYITGNRTTEDKIEDLRLSLADARQRLQIIRDRLRNTPKNVVTEVRTEEQQVRPERELESQLEDKQGQLAQLRNRFTDAAPAIVQLKKDIAELEERISELKQKPAVKSSTGESTTTVLNPEYQELTRLEMQFNLTIRGIERQLNRLQATRARNESILQRMPSEEIEYQRIMRDFTLADTMRNQLRNQLYNARIEEERERLTQALLIKMAIPPKAERQNTGAKGMILYILGPILGLIIAFAFSLIAEALDHTLRTPVEVEKHLGKPVLAVLPRIRPTKEERKALGGAARQQLPG